ncbi:FAD-dependent tricarballylate dehydrogenase TcuA [Patulibacter defluvii]|uniref:FAD-dependent tricarballylate dehydrogenase TcuA n=1 Tax=Patulibacter defluvii TaxID=3095358 RepID=UPI002A76212B|nr:FAD-dependent tricarballylate dehydrogenase TcuA [Patulibacter sp. DM4]
MTPKSNGRVVVVGGGNAGLSAAIAAAERGARVVLLEKAPEPLNGGNSRYTAGLIRFGFSEKDEVRRFLADMPEDEWQGLRILPYPAERFYDDLMQKSQGKADLDLTDWIAHESYDVIDWLAQHGVRWQTLTYIPTARETGFADGILLEAAGGGPGLVRMELEEAARLGVEVRYEHAAQDLVQDEVGEIVGVRVRDPEGRLYVEPGRVVLASGGFEANPEMRSRYLGPAWNVVKVRAVRYNTGEMLDAALRVGALPYGHWAGAHCSPIDPDSPEMGTLESSDETNKLSFSQSISVNLDGERFIDEGADWNTKMYVSMGKAVSEQPYGRAFQLFDAKTSDLVDQRYDPKAAVVAESLDELARRLGIDPTRLAETVAEYNAAVPADGPDFDPSRLDGRATSGIHPPKSNWAVTVDQPPFVAYEVVTGITFTFGGLKVNRDAQVLDMSERPIPGLYAAGETTGGFFYYQYPAGSGLLCGALTGRAAGWHAAAAGVDAASAAAPAAS